MSTNFTEKFAPSIVSVLGCHDRVIFKGHLPFGRDEHLERGRFVVSKCAAWISCLSSRSNRRLSSITRRLRAAEAGVPYQPLQGQAQEGELCPGPPPQMPAARGPGHRAPGHGNLPHRQTPTWSGPAGAWSSHRPQARPLLLFPRSRIWPHARSPTDLVSLTRPFAATAGIK